MPNRYLLPQIVSLMALGLSACFSMPGVTWTVNTPRPAPSDTLAPLLACASQRGLPAERVGDAMQVRMDQESVLEYRYDANHNMVMGVRFLQELSPLMRAQRSEAAHARGNDIYACAGYGIPTYVGAIEPPPAPMMYASQPTPAPMQPAPPAPEQGPVGPMCQRLNDCYNDMVHAACKNHDTHCMQRFASHPMSEGNCEVALGEISKHEADINRGREGFVMPPSCKVH